MGHVSWAGLRLSVKGFRTVSVEVVHTSILNCCSSWFSLSLCVSLSSGWCSPLVCSWAVWSAVLLSPRWIWHSPPVCALGEAGEGPTYWNKQDAHIFSYEVNTRSKIFSLWFTYYFGVLRSRNVSLTSSTKSDAFVFGSLTLTLHETKKEILWDWFDNTISFREEKGCFIQTPAVCFFPLNLISEF